MSIDPENRVTNAEVTLVTFEGSEVSPVALSDRTDCSDADSDFTDFTDNWGGADPVGIGDGGGGGSDPGGGGTDDGLGLLLD